MTAADTDRLTSFYGAFSSTPDQMMAALAAAGVTGERLDARDLYIRGLDCHNLGMYATLERIAKVADEYGAPGPDDTVLDLGCGMGGPGRFLVDRFGCSVVGVDLLPLRIEIAQELTEKTGLESRISYRIGDATALGFDDASFDQVWMLDVSMHIRDKRALFHEIARVLVPGRLLVMHEQTGPLPKAMRPVMRLAPYIAPPLPQLVRYVEDAGLRLLTWRDTTDRVLAYFDDIRALLNAGSPATREVAPADQQEIATVIVDSYIAALRDQGGRTGLLLASRS